MMKVYFYTYKRNPKVLGASPFINDVYRMMEGKVYNDIRMYSTSVSNCLYALFKTSHVHEGLTQSDNYWLARYIEENESLVKSKVRKPTLDFLRYFWSN